jgi:phage-related baseplate assembly protein
MSKTKQTPIKYTSRDFNSIKNDLAEHAKRYYPEQWKDFSKSTVNALLVDTVAYVGDVLSYYLDYAVNESFLDTSVEYNNIRKHARSLGYKYAGVPNSYGIVALFCLVPSNGAGTAPDFAYVPTISRGTQFTSTTGGVFSLTEDVRFDDANNQIVAARFNSSTGATTHFAIKAYGQVVSGVFQRITVDLSDSSFERFRRVRIGDPGISEILSIEDSDGNKYYEVENLAQEVIFQETTNPTALTDGVRSIIKPFVASRRFVMDQDDTGTYIQFGFGSEDDPQEGLADPSQVAIKMHGKRSISNLSFDPSKLLQTSKMGISPSSTILTIVAKSNTETNTNVSTGDLTNITNRLVTFDNINDLSTVKVQSVITSIEAINEEPIVGGTEQMTNEELRERAKTYYATQNRAVTKQDYISMIHNMPAKFGKIKRVSIANDPSATNRRVPMYVISEDENGKLTTANSRIKGNLKNWIMQYKSLNDVIDIFDAKIVNFGVDFKLTVDSRYSRDSVLGKCVTKIQEYFSDQLYIGEPIYITRMYTILGKVEGVSDVRKVEVFQKYGGVYSTIRMSFDDALSQDGTYINTPKNVIMELKYPDADIRGTIV